MPKSKKSQIVIDACRRFPNLPTRTLARHILATHGEQFENNLEKIRGSVRNYRQQNGQKSREQLAKEHLDIAAKTKPALPQTWRKVRSSYKTPVGLGLILADAHIPFHEPKPLEAAVQAGQAEKVDWILLLGDWQDCAAVTFWPTAHRDFNREIEAVADSLDWLRNEFPTQPIIYKPGNHEYRLPRYFVNKATELAESPIAAMETLLGFEERNIEFLDYHQMVMAGKLPLIHGHEVPAITKAVNAARGLFLRTKTWSACAHCHSTSEHSPTDIHGELLTTWSIGCLCDLHPDYNPFGVNWNHGFALLNVEKDGNFEMVNRRILPNGKVV